VSGWVEVHEAYAKEPVSQRAKVAPAKESHKIQHN
jgi:hypothetical protein